MNDIEFEKRLKERVVVAHSNTPISSSLSRAKYVYKKPINKIEFNPNTILLDLSNFNITDLNFIKDFKSLKKLALPNNNIEDASILEGTDIDALNIRMNKVKVLPVMYDLKKIDISYNLIEDEEFKKFKFYYSLNVLYASSINITVASIPIINGMFLLNELILRGNFLKSDTELIDIDRLEFMEKLSLRKTGITDIVLTKDCKIIDLDIAYTNISKDRIINLVNMMPNLKTLWLSRDQGIEFNDFIRFNVKFV
jgi:hypothetical protein